jgi:hypothetical protein
MLVRNGHLFSAAAIFGWSANAIGKVTDEPLFRAGGHGCQQNRGDNGKQQQQRRKSHVHTQPIQYSLTHSGIMAVLSG